MSALARRIKHVSKLQFRSFDFIAVRTSSSAFPRVYVNYQIQVQYRSKSRWKNNDLSIARYEAF